MISLARSYYSAPIATFLTHSDHEIIGQLALRNEFALEEQQRSAWLGELQVLKASLDGIDGHILLEYSIPRMGKRVDVVLLLDSLILVLEFKVGERQYPTHAVDQVLDYSLDLKNFHEESHNRRIVPIVVCAEAPEQGYSFVHYHDDVYSPILANRHNLRTAILQLARERSEPTLDPVAWENAKYRPTPTIIEAAQALYRGHNVTEISRSEGGAYNLSQTSDEIARIIRVSKGHRQKSICFVTGVPGAGKTLAGLNIANSWQHSANGEHAVFLSGNGPLVAVLREALARGEVANAKARGEKLRKASALQKVRAFVQNVHHFRDDTLSRGDAPVERVVVFDEAQRAWTQRMLAKFMKAKKNTDGFLQSEPEFLISVIDRHKDWATIICLIGGGQEINTGEAGLREWFAALRKSFPHWKVYVSTNLADSEYVGGESLDSYIKGLDVRNSESLHLSVSVRSYRSERVSALVKSLLDCRSDEAFVLTSEVLKTYPICVTRDFSAAKEWLRSRARGTERYGVIASSEARRLKPCGVNVAAPIDPRHWFLNGKEDVRSCYYLEDVATEFQIQGLELDWTCVAWDADLRYANGSWDCRRFQATSWRRVHDVDSRTYLKNAYRVLLTRARQGMVIYVPPGDNADSTRLPKFYDPTYDYFRTLGIPDLDRL